MNGNLLGKQVRGPSGYDPRVLHPIMRTPGDLAMFGFDLWRAYELSWLNPRGKPEIAILELIFPLESSCIVESKSLKFYLAGLSQERFADAGEISRVIRDDLARVLKAPWVGVHLIAQAALVQPHWESVVRGVCVDGIDLEIADYREDAGLLKSEKERVVEVIFSDLLRSLCPITNQPDWGTVVVDYRGHRIDHTAFLRYIVSYRGHEGFAEECCESIFTDISKRCRPEEITVSCRYTRRGGIDINPVRSSHPLQPDEVPQWRLVRQ